MAVYKLPGNQVVCIPWEFVDYYMKDADPTFVKVYIYGRRQCYSDNPKCNVSDVALALGILESDVLRAWKYWEGKGVVSLICNSTDNPTDFGIEFADLSCTSDSKQGPKENAKPTYKISDITNKETEDHSLKEMYTHAEMLLGRTLSQNDIITLYGFYDWLELPVEVILMIIEHCVSMDKKNMRYMETVALSWYDMGICTAEKASSHLSAIEKKSKAKRHFKKLLNITGRDLSDSECAYIAEWSENMGFSDEMIKLAYEKTVLSTGKVTFQYMHAILKDWHNNGIDTPDKVKTEPKKAVKKATHSPKTKFNSYTQSGDYDLDEIESMALRQVAKNKEGF
ncbi:MAG: DnaD domain protein [Bacillota bacterium]|nr:DnaD domain protein [Bacillota bacterium]